MHNLLVEEIPELEKKEEPPLLIPITEHKEPNTPCANSPESTTSSNSIDKQDKEHL
jgi:hypothetical protein